MLIKNGCVGNLGHCMMEFIALYLSSYTMPLCSLTDSRTVARPDNSPTDTSQRTYPRRTEARPASIPTRLTRLIGPDSIPRIHNSSKRMFVSSVKKPL